MEVFLIIKRQKTTIFLIAKESDSVLELKRMIEGITHTPPDRQKLFKGEKFEQVMDDNKSLSDYGLTSAVARAQQPETIGLAFKLEDDFEELEMAHLSSPPELPDVMKPTETQQPPPGKEIPA